MSTKVSIDIQEFADILTSTTFALTSCRDTEGILAEILQQLQRIIPHAAAHISLVEDEQIIVRKISRYAEQFPQERLTAYPRFTLEKQVIQTQTPLIIDDTTCDPYWMSEPDLNWIKSTLIIPLPSQDKVIGLLCLDSDLPQHFHAEQLYYLRPIASIAAAALENALLRQKLEHELIECQKIEQALKVSEHTARLLFEENPIPMTVFDRETYQYLDVNQITLKKYGYSREEFLSKTIFDLRPPEEHAHIRQIIDRDQGILDRHASRHRLQDGTIIEVEITAKPILFQGHKAVIAVAEDVTERNQLQEHVRESEELYRSLVESSNAAILVVDGEGRYHFVNSVAADKVDLTPEAMLGTTLTDTFGPEIGAQAILNIQKVLKSAQGIVFERFASLRNNTYWLRINMLPIRNAQGGVTQVMVNAVDITAQKLIELRLQKMVQRMIGLQSINHAILEAHSVEQMTAIATQHLLELLPCQITGVMSLDMDRGVGFIRALAGDMKNRQMFVGKPVLLQKMFDMERLSQGQTVIIRNADELPSDSSMRKVYMEQGLLSSLHVPLVAHDRLIGILNVGSTTADAFSPEDIETAQEVANMAAIAIRQTQLHREVEKHASDLELRVKQRTIEMHEAKERVEAILNSSSDGVALLDTERGLRQTNPAFDTIFEVAEDALLGQALTVLVASKDRARLRKAIRTVVSSGQSQILEIQAVTHAGRAFPAEISLAPIENQKTALVCGVRDITQRKATEHQLRYHASLQAVVSDAVFTTDLTYRVQTWNLAAERIYGWSEAEMRGQDVNLMLQTLYIEHSLPELEQIFLANGGWIGEIIQFHKNGNTLYIQCSATLLRDEQGQPFGVIVVNRDISHRKEMERKLHYHASLQATVSDAVIALDTEWRIQSWNAAAERLYGWTAKEATTKLVMDVFGIEFFQDRQMEEILEQLRQQSWWSGELVQTARDGRQLYVLSSINTINDENGILIGTVFINHDITPRKQMEQQLQYHASLQKTVHEAVISTDMDFKIQSWNPAAEQIYGWTAAEVQNLHVGEILKSIYLDTTPEKIKEQFFQVGYWEGEVIQHHKNGTPIHILGSVVLLKDDQGKPFGIVAVNHNINERKKQEEALRHALAHERELGELKTRFVSMASHEFRTPLATILAAAETLGAYRHRMDEPQIDRRLGKIREQVDHLRSVIEDVLTLSRLEGGHIEFNPISADLDGLCQTVIDEYRHRPDIKHTLIYECDRQPFHLNFDPIRMRQILNNLISNAIKYSPNLMPITISLTEQDRMAVLKISDQGIGIPTEDQPHLFKPFHRGSNVSTIVGTGLGLSITKQAVELHGGILTVQSMIKQGTTVIMKFPGVSA